MATVVNYISRDFVQINADIKQNLRSAIPTVNDFLESNEGRFLIDQWSGIAEMLGFVIDRQAAETYVDTVETRANLISLLKLIGYRPLNPSPERAVLTLTRTGDNDSENLTIPKHSEFSAFAKNGTALVFSTEADVTIPAGESSVEVTAAQGTWASLNYTSNGGAGQSFILPSVLVAEGYVEVQVNGQSWNLAENNSFVGHLPTDHVYRVVALTDKRMLVEFGDGIEGMIPIKGHNIKIDYMITQHVNGHVNANTIIGSLTSNLAVRSNNVEPSAGGADFEPINTARYRYPKIFRAMHRAVTLEDWEALASEVPGVMQVRAIDRNIDPSMPFFLVRLLVLGNDGFISSQLNQDVYNHLRTRKINGTAYEVVSPNPIKISVVGKVQVFRNYDDQEVLSEVHQTVFDFFKVTADRSSEVELGRPVYLSRLITAINEIEGVASVRLTSPITDIMVKPTEYVSLGTVNLEVGGIS